MKLTPDQILQGRYTIVRPLGEGGTGTTYEAKDADTGKTVAIKALSLRSLQDWKTLELFQREVHVLRSLDHPGIPTYLDAIREEDPDHGEVLLLVQQRVKGHDLQTLISQREAISEDTARQWAVQILHILIYLHERTPATIHRDIKPGNLILRPDGKLFMVDFGAVRHAVRNEKDFASTMVGTYGYMAPEQLRSQADPTTDLYGLGATLVALLTATDPAKLPHERLRIVFDDHVTLTSGFSHWLNALLAPVPEDRPSSARQALRDLENLDDQRSPQPPSRPQRKPLSQRRADAKRASNRRSQIQPPKDSHIILEHNAQGMHIKLRKSPRLFSKPMIVFVSATLTLLVMWWLQLLPGYASFVSLAPFVWLGLFAWGTESTRQQVVSLGEDQLTLADKFWGLTWRKRSIDRHKIQHIETNSRRFKTRAYTRISTRKDKHEVGQFLTDKEQHWLSHILHTWCVGGHLETRSSNKRKPDKHKHKQHQRKQHKRKTLPPPSPKQAKQAKRVSKKRKQSRAKHQKQRRK